ncbi:hypothetical protein LJR034_009122 [Caballeronia sp. LjRoot34]
MELARTAEEVRKLAAKAREAGAKLAGQLEATRTQNAALLAAMKEVGTTDKSTKGGKGAAKSPRPARRSSSAHVVHNLQLAGAADCERLSADYKTRDRAGQNCNQHEPCVR